MKKSVVIVMFVMFMACLWLAVSVVESYGQMKPRYPSTPVYTSDYRHNAFVQDMFNRDVEQYNIDLDNWKDRQKREADQEDKLDEIIHGNSYVVPPVDFTVDYGSDKSFVDLMNEQ